MNAQRKSFRREGEDFRRRELVEATLTCIATLGMERTTVREIAIKAGVTAGLIRHYFSTKDELVLAAYSQYVAAMAAQSREAVESASPDPLHRLAAFVRANLSAPVVDQTNLSLWAGFIETIRTNSEMATIHLEGYHGYRSDAETLIRAAYAHENRNIPPEKLRGMGIALNAIIDGLWLEGSMSPGEFAEGELAQIGLTAASALLGIDLQKAEMK
jgi:TetR/AcrR family transcriptional regulator, transcriptional repressor of bet genes